MPVLSNLGRVVFTALPNGLDASGRPRVSIYMLPRLGTSAPLEDYSEQVVKPLVDPGLTLKAFRLTWRTKEGAAIGKPVLIPVPTQRINGLFWAVFKGVKVRAIADPDAPSSPPKAAVAAAASAAPAREVRSFPAFDIADSLKRVTVSHAARVVPPPAPNAALAAAPIEPGLEETERVGLVRLPSRDEVLAGSRGIAFRNAQRLSPAEKRRRQIQLAREFERSPGLKQYLESLAEDPVAELSLHTIRAARELFTSSRSNTQKPALPQAVAPAALQAEPQPEESIRARAFLQFAAFHGTRKPEVEPQAAAASSTTLCKEHDFHDYLNMLRGHPLLLRALGLVFDVVVPPPPPSAELVEIGPATDVAGLKLVLCRTVFDWKADDRRFHPRPKDSLYRDGFLDLSDCARFRLESLDFIGGAFKALQQADALTPPRRPSEDGADSEGVSVPSLRSAGVSLLWSGRGKHVQDRLRLGDETTPREREAPTLYAEDVTVGYRPDVHQSLTNGWHSLCRRDPQESKYTFPGLDKRTWRLSDLAGDSVAGEGAVHLTVATPEGAPAHEYHAHEAIFRWDGWSVAAPSPLDRAFEEKQPALCSPALGFHADFRVSPCSLPLLRFGTAYRMRCRTVDLAGNGREADEPMPEPAPVSTSLDFKRYEPVPSPVVLLSERLDPKRSPGEQLDRLVIRTGRDSNSRSSRYVVPARVSFRFAELHGVFDHQDQLPSSAFHGIRLVSDGSFPIYGPRDEGDPAKQNAYLEYDGSAGLGAPACPYYPDPLSLGARVTIVNGGQERGLSTVHRFYDGADWPDAQPCRVDLRPSRDGNLSWKWQTLPVGGAAALTGRTVHTLTVELPEAEVLELNLSSDLGDPNKNADLLGKKMALWDGLRSKASVDEESLRRNVHAGQHWLFTPSRKLTLVHAVRRPLEAPNLSATVRRRAGDTKATFSGNLRIHGKSTGRVDLLLSWKDPVDDPLSACWQWQHRAPILELPLPKFFDQAKSPLPASNESQVSVDHDFGDTKHHRILCQPSAGSAFTDYFKPRPDAPRCGPDADFSICGDTLELPVPSTVRPDPPLVDYVMPTFEWEPLPQGRLRLGGGLRVWLRRPWFSSGEGERLAVLLWPCSDAGALPEAELPENLPSHVTAWGADPLWSSQPVSGRFPTVADLKGVARLEVRNRADKIDTPGPVFVQGVWLKAPSLGANSTRVDIVAYRPEFDGSRRMWFCDVEFKPGASYFPFVRLALARYQRHAVENLNLSEVVVADFAQLAPDRWATVRRTASDKHAVELQVRGVAPNGSCARPSRNPLHVMLEENTRSGDSELGWVPSLDAAGKEIAQVVEARADGGDALWRTIVSLPKKGRGRRYRLALREFEVYEADLDDPTARQEHGRAYASRLVYAEMLPIPR